jgi:serine/threonine protein kinase
MNAERWKKIDETFDAVLEIPVVERAAFLRSIADEDLRREIEELLKAHGDAENFIESNALEITARKIADKKTEKRRIAHYEIISLLGAGGMSEVYLAQDTKLNRKVALKILPSHFVSDADRVRRFRLEAESITALNHPNIVTVFDFGAEADELYIATELVEGKSLREILNTEKLPPLEILKIAAQIAEALQAAHAAGIVHRDIKPENIMIRADGYVKVLDFGLAKLTENHESENHSNTKSGLVVGTLNYISPEQALGERLTACTDLWSLGVVLFEMLAGKPAFSGATQAAVFDAILHKEIEAPSRINPNLVPEFDRIVSKALEKDCELRYQTAADFRADLKRLMKMLDSSAVWSSDTINRIPKTINSGSSFWRNTAIAGIILLLFGASGFALWRYFKSNSSAPDWTRAVNTQLTDNAGTEYFPSLAPDGKSFVYAAETDGKFDVFVQRIGGKNAQNLTADSPANDTQPAFSPDGERIVFRSERKPEGIYVIGATGENARRVCDFGFHPSWSPDGKEITVTELGRDLPNVRGGTTSAVWRINIETGEKRELIRNDAVQPAWSPNGKRIAFWYMPTAQGRRDVATISADGGEPVVVTKDFAVTNWNPVWSPDGKYLYFVSDKSGNMNFWRVPIDQTTGAVLGEPEAVVMPSKFSRHLSFSRDGRRMIYVQTNNQSNIQTVAFDQKAEKIIGETEWITSGDREVTRAELSPDGTQFVMRMIRRTQDDIILVSRDGKTQRDLTNDAPFDRYPRWSPDGKQIAFASDRNGNYQIFMIGADGANLRQITSATAPSGSFPIFSPDGRRLAYTGANEAFILDLTGNPNERTPRQIQIDTGSRMSVWDWSPDGKKLACVLFDGMERSIGVYSLETNRYEKIVPAGDVIPSWMPDSRRLIYAVENKIFIADIETKKTREVISHPTDHLRSPFVSRDGLLLYYTVHTSENDVWMLDLE